MRFFFLSHSYLRGILKFMLSFLRLIFSHLYAHLFSKGGSRLPLVCTSSDLVWHLSKFWEESWGCQNEKIPGRPLNTPCVLSHMASRHLPLPRHGRHHGGKDFWRSGFACISHWCSGIIFKYSIIIFSYHYCFIKFVSPCIPLPSCFPFTRYRHVSISVHAKLSWRRGTYRGDNTRPFTLHSSLLFKYQKNWQLLLLIV